MVKDDKHICDFCGKTQDEVSAMIAGPGVDICDGCVELCRDIIGVKRYSKVMYDPEYFVKTWNEAEEENSSTEDSSGERSERRGWFKRS